MKRIITALLISFILITLGVAFTLSASAETLGGNYNENVTWTLDTETGELIISGTGEIERFYQAIEPHTGSVKTVRVEEGITRIGDSTFYHMDNITSIRSPTV